MTEAQRQALLALIESIREVGASHQRDNEQGVAWLNEQAAAKWAKENKHYLAAAISMHSAAATVEKLFGLEEGRTRTYRFELQRTSYIDIEVDAENETAAEEKVWAEVSGRNDTYADWNITSREELERPVDEPSPTSPG